MRNWNLFLFLPTLTLANEGLLLDTRHATSDLGWTVAPGSEWDEVSGHGADRNEYRMLQVCEIQQPNQDNWIRSHYINNYGANRVFVEIEFTIRSCEDLRNVAVCKETFNLYFYEADSQNDLPEWNAIDFTKVDTIAADRRFKPGEDQTNKETREIGPLKKKGLFIAIQDAGACMSIMHMRVYYKYCPRTVHNLAQYEKQNSGPNPVSLVPAEGRCVPNAIKDSTPKYHCNAHGNWTINSGSCQCSPGYTPNAERTECVACEGGMYKSTTGNEKCRSCPGNSSTYGIGNQKCDCVKGYNRAAGENVDLPCTRRPSKPRNLKITPNHTSAKLDWDKPNQDGGRSDLKYDIGCMVCTSKSYASCRRCSSSVEFEPLTEFTSATIDNLESNKFYKFKVIAINGVTGEYDHDMYPDYAEAMTQTLTAATSQPNQGGCSFGIREIPITLVTSSRVRFEWDSPAESCREKIIEYKTLIKNRLTGSVVINETIHESIEITNLEPQTTYSITVQARSRSGYGPESVAVEFTTKETGDDITTNPTTMQSSSTDNTAKIAGIAAGVAIIIIMVVVFLVICTKRNSYKKGRKFVTELDGHTDVTFQPVHPFQPDHGAFPPVQQWDHEILNQVVAKHAEPIDLDPNRVTVGAQIRNNVDEAYELLKGSIIVDGYGAQSVLVKKLKANATPQQKAEFKNDSAILSRVNHENVVHVDGLVNHHPALRGVPAIVTEFMEHTSLDEFLRVHRREINQNQQLKMMVDVSAGMKYLVDQGFVHRDLAAKNIQCNAQLKCKIADFSLARKLSESLVPHQVGRCLYKWSAPEAISQRRFSEASDVWSFGVVAWEIQNFGESPYWEMNDEEVIRKIESGYRLPCTSGCPPQVHQLMLDCWKAAPNERAPFNLILKTLSSFVRSNSGHQTSHRSSQYSGSCMTLDSNTSATSSLGNWLEGIGLGHYRERLQQNGYMTLEHIVSMSRRDLQELGIVSVSEQKHLMDQARVLHNTNKNSRSVGYSQRCEMSLERGTIIGV